MSTTKKVAKKVATKKVETKRIFVDVSHDNEDCCCGDEYHIYVNEPTKSDLREGCGDVTVCRDGLHQAFGKLNEDLIENQNIDVVEIEFQVIKKKYYSYSQKSLVKEEE